MTVESGVQQEGFGAERLAIAGGEPAARVRTGVPHPKIGVEEFLSIAGRFGFTPEALERIAAAVSDDDLMGGGPNLARRVLAFPTPPAGEEYEALARATFGVEHAVSVSSGTAALHAAFVAVGVRPGAEVICSAIGFMATAAAVLLAGGIPVFCDVDDSLHMDPNRVEDLITDRTVAIAPTHVMGSICDIGPIVEIAHRHGLKVVEDCAQSPGGRYRGRYVGAIGDVGIFSISAYKIIGGGESGLLITNDARIAERAWQLAECGGLWRPDRFAPPRYDGELFVGTNYRMSELEAAVDLVQLRKLADVVSRYHRAKMRILSQIEPVDGIALQKLNDPDGEIGYLLRLFAPTPQLALNIAEALTAEGVDATARGPEPRPDWHIYRDMFPVVLAGDPAAMRCRPGDCPVADDLWRREVTIPVDQWASEHDCDCVARAINKVLRALCGSSAQGLPR